MVLYTPYMHHSKSLAEQRAGTLSIFSSLAVTSRCASPKHDALSRVTNTQKAVRNAHDLNVTAMPHKYRRMADFHEYYSGSRIAPYLTIFIGGNHEASNHLFELYYGGWVAPNIYYLGAANIVRLGPLRIAGLSGIWKGYDYRKPHFERLPYSEDNLHSIFHVRELDVRKLLSVRSQVDIGLSHDWPEGVVWQGNYNWLFRRKDRFEEDAINKKLGSIAAAQCLAQLRPAYWFSAHLHIKYAALVDHTQPGGVGGRPPVGNERPAVKDGPSEAGSTLVGTDSLNSISDSQVATVPTNGRAQDRSTQISAWQNFHVSAQKDDAEDRDRALKERQERDEEEARTGIRSRPQYTFNETFKQISTDDSLGRSLKSVTTSSPAPEESSSIPNLDGCGHSSLKRRRTSTPPEPMIADRSDHVAPGGGRQLPSSLDGTIAGSTVVASATDNPDAIEIDFSDSASETGNVIYAPGDRPSTSAPNDGPLSESVLSDDVEDGGVRLNPLAQTFAPSIRSVKEPNNADMNPLAESFTPRSSISSTAGPENGKASYSEAREVAGATTNEVSEEMRAQLARLSNSFALQKKSEPLPFPNDITNTTTNFLALDKCEPNRELLQLLEIEPDSIVSQPPPKLNAGGRPYKLQYDPEWLAILRVFAPELSLKDKAATPSNKGDQYYRERILEEERWVEENIVQPEGRLAIPENFSVTAPIYDPVIKVGSHEMPREYTNPQTTQFCALIGIENHFDISEEERDARIAAGVYHGDRQNSFRGRGRGGRHGGGGG